MAWVREGPSYRNPRSLRKTLAHFGEQLPLTPEAWKAWSRNLVHGDEMTTYRGYGEVPGHRQAQSPREFECLPDESMKVGKDSKDALARQIRVAKPNTRSEIFERIDIQL